MADVTFVRTAHKPVLTLSVSIAIVASPWLATFVHWPSPPSKLSARTTVPGSPLEGAGVEPQPPLFVIVHDQVAGVASTLPTASIARTPNVCAPTARPEYVAAELHAANA